MKLSDTERQVLRLLYEKGRLRYSEIAEEMNMSPGGLTKLLKRLQNEELINRIQENIGYPPPVFYELTEKGKMLLEAEEMYMALIEFDPEEAEELIDEIKRKIEELKSRKKT